MIKYLLLQSETGHVCHHTLVFYGKRRKLQASFLQAKQQN